MMATKADERGFAQMNPKAVLFVLIGVYLRKSAADLFR